VGIKAGDGARLILVPMTMLKIDSRFGKIKVRAITAAQFADVPGLKNPNQVTLLEEDKICAYFGGGTLYATAARSEPLI
jgi:photosynthetic reaction center H subunit